MKNGILITLLLVSVITNAQEWNGVKVGLSLDKTVSAFLSKGFLYDWDDKNDCKGICIVALKGSAKTVQIENLYLLYDKDSSQVFCFKIYLPFQQDNMLRKKQYFEYFNKLKTKYGAPIKYEDGYVGAYEAYWSNVAIQNRTPLGTKYNVIQYGDIDNAVNIKIMQRQH